MRVVVFTGDAALSAKPWWQVVRDHPAIEHVLVCRKIQSHESREVFRRFRRNLKYHGWIFVPYRLGLLCRNLLRRWFGAADTDHRLPRKPIEEIVALDIHAADVVERVRSFGADLGLSLGAPLLRPALFGLPRMGTLNMHLGKVPEFRGAPPAFWELMYGATTIGATVHWIDEGLDTGPIVVAAEAPIYTQDTLRDVEDRVAELGVRILGDAVSRVSRGDLGAAPQAATGHKPNRAPTVRQRFRLAFRMYGRRAVMRLQPRSFAKSLALASAVYLYRPVRDLIRRLRRRQPVRIFTYHRITSLCRDGMTVSPRAFREHVAYLARHCDIVTVERALELIRGGARLKRPAAVLTFDDGYRSVYEAARPILAEFGVPGASFVCTDIVGTTQRFEHDRANPMARYLDVMTWADLKELLDGGWSIGSHTATHARLSMSHGPALRREIEEPRRVLKDRLGVDAQVLAYPFGAASDISGEALELSKRVGHTAVFANFGGENVTGSSEPLMHRFDIGANHDRLASKAFAHGIYLGEYRSLWPRATPPSVELSDRSADPLRVTHVVFDFNGGGMETLVAEMARRFRGSNVKLSLVTLSGRVGRLGAMVRDQFEQFHVVRPIRVVSMVMPLRVAKAIRSTRADVVHIHSGCWWKGARAARLAGVRHVVYTEHGREFHDPWFSRWLDRRAALRTNAVVAVSKRLAGYLATAVGVDRTIISTIHNGVDTQAFTPGPPPVELRAALGIPGNALVIGSIGRLEPVKAFDRLLDAAALLRRTLDRPFAIVLCGDGSQRQHLLDHARRIGISDIVHLPGWSDDAVQFYRLLDVFVLSSISEGQSISLMEAMACGISPVVTDVGANAEVVGPELSHCVVPAGNTPALAAAINGAVNGQNRRETSALARRRAVEAFSLDSVAANYERLYRGLMNPLSAAEKP